MTRRSAIPGHRLRPYKARLWHATCECGWRHATPFKLHIERAVRAHKAEQRERQRVNA